MFDEIVVGVRGLVGTEVFSTSLGLYLPSFSLQHITSTTVSIALLIIPETAIYMVIGM